MSPNLLENILILFWHRIIIEPLNPNLSLTHHGHRFHKNKLTKDRTPNLVHLKKSLISMLWIQFKFLPVVTLQMDKWLLQQNDSTFHR